MKKLVSALVVTALFCSHTFSHAAEPEQKHVSLSVGSSILNYLPAPLSVALGNFQKEGLDVQVENFQAGGSKALQALIAGSTDAVVGFYDHTIHMQAQGKDIISVVVLNNTPGMVLAVQPGINSGKDLKGKRIGVTTPGSSTDLFARYYVSKNGLTPDQDVSFISVGSGAPGMTAFERKQVDALVNFDPVASLIEQRKAGKFLVDTRTAEGTKTVFGGPYPTACLYVTRQFMEKNPDTVQHLVNAFVRTLKWIDSNTPETITDKLPREQLVGGRDEYIESLRHSKGIFSKDGAMDAAGPKTALAVLSSYDEKIRDAKVDLNKTYTNRFVDNALKTIH
ncbi:ABC transporter substrate-binding protein [Burkholderia pseudomallei]|uniref:ABC transporter substrate-binding protein n=1 Tax=Burkholderia pseudomallei TaxID=28450 RepID=UPI000A1A2E54|nr:ABC transporter substrate-binding protein [Burkholderia pseudomallei]ARL91326.1 myristoyl transferase [Burkholderia pseudomallei]MBH9657974.1 ABC transporter substrate-binding protein [Burkholderia pseudomallei]NRD83771.1 transporter substrate-binding domain-containing protein [Burkholderia pseudomallei]